MAYWIWLDDSKYPEFSENRREQAFSINEKGFCMAEFLSEYSLKGNGRIRICADARYELYVNGALLGRGPASCGSDFLTEKMEYCYYDEYEITDTSSVKIALDVAASEWYNGVSYTLPKSQKSFTDDELIERLRC